MTPNATTLLVDLLRDAARGRLQPDGKDYPRVEQFVQSVIAEAAAEAVYLATTARAAEGGGV